MIYLDHHATTPCDPAVIEAMVPYFAERFGNANARLSRHGRDAARALGAAKSDIAALVGCTPEALTLTSGASAGNRIALTGLPVDDRDELLVSALEHPSVVEAARASGMAMKIVPASKDGFITEEALASLLSARTRVVSVMAASHEIGTIQQVHALAARAHAAGALFHCDATQAVGRIPFAVGEIDLVSFTAHKLYGPIGIGALYVRPTPPLGLALPHLGTPPLALAVGFGVACALAREGLREDAAHLTMLTETFLAALGPHTLNGAPSPRLPGSLSLAFPGVDAETLLLELDGELSLSTGAACGSGKREPSPVLRAIGRTDAEIAGSVRLCFGRGNTLEEARRAGELLARRAGA